MKKTKKILCPIDFSESSANAFRYALLLADQLGASIEVIHATLPVVDTLPYAGYCGTTTAALAKALKEQAETFVKSNTTLVLHKLQQAPFVTTEVLLGTPIQDITGYAKKENIDFILMGTHGKNKSKSNKFMGSTAAGVIESADYPVIVIPENVSFQLNINMTYATDLSVADPFEIWKATELLDPLVPSIRVVHVRQSKENVADKNEKMEEIENYFVKYHSDININFHATDGVDLQKELDTFTRIYKTDIVIMYRPHHSFWNRLFLKNNRKEVTTKTPYKNQFSG